MPTTNSIAGSSAQSSRLPHIAAIFAIRFDQRVGYTIAWQRRIRGLELSGAVEYKSLPSGLHNIKEDLIYFIHESYAGISAFQSAEASAAERSARFVSVGVLVPRGNGRFGRGWLHAQKLKELATALLEKPDEFEQLDEWWGKHRIVDSKNVESSTPRSSSDGNLEDRTEGESDYEIENGNESENEDRFVRGISESTTIIKPSLSSQLSPSHPVLSILNLLDLLGPLVFPIYRASLLRKRILFISKPPLLRSCNLVYNLSILSTIPIDLSEDLPEDLADRVQPLFNIGVHDIPFIEKLSKSTERSNMGWIACTSDEVLATKSSLSDVRIDLSNSGTTQSLAWPIVTSTQLGSLKATQRDLRRYKTLRNGLEHFQKHHLTLSLSRGSSHQHEDRTKLLPKSVNDTQTEVNVSAESTVIEPAPWAAVLYDSFMWWASAGARNSLDLDIEHEQDRDLLAAATEVWESCSDPEGAGALETAVIAYFHRLTTNLLSGLGELVDGDQEQDTGDHGEESAAGQGASPKAVTMKVADLVGIGLDGWSQVDRQFVVEMSKTYFEMDVEVKGASVEWCGVKVC